MMTRNSECREANYPPGQQPPSSNQRRLYWHQRSPVSKCINSNSEHNAATKSPISACWASYWRPIGRSAQARMAAPQNWRHSERVPHNEVAQCIEQVCPDKRLCFPRVREHVPQLDLFRAERADLQTHASKHTHTQKGTQTHMHTCTYARTYTTPHNRLYKQGSDDDSVSTIIHYSAEWFFYIFLADHCPASDAEFVEQVPSQQKVQTQTNHAATAKTSNTRKPSTISQSKLQWAT